MTETRVCRLCLRELPIDAFALHPGSHGYPPYRRTACRACLNLRRHLRRPQPAGGQRRVCKKCGKDKPLADFYANTGGYRQWTCKTCCSAQAALNKRRRMADPEYAARQRADARERQRRKRAERMAALLERVNAAPTEKLTPQNGFAKMKAEPPADSQVPTKTHPRAACNGTEGANHVHVGGVKHG